MKINKEKEMYILGLKHAIGVIKKTEKERWRDEVHCSCLPYTIEKIKELIKKNK